MSESESTSEFFEYEKAREAAIAGLITLHRRSVDRLHDAAQKISALESALGQAVHGRFEVGHPNCGFPSLTEFGIVTGTTLVIEPSGDSPHTTGQMATVTMLTSDIERLASLAKFQKLSWRGIAWILIDLQPVIAPIADPNGIDVVSQLPADHELPISVLTPPEVIRFRTGLARLLNGEKIEDGKLTEVRLELTAGRVLDDLDDAMPLTLGDWDRIKKEIRL